MAFNTASDVRRVLHLDSSNEVLTDLEIDDYLADANFELYTQIKKKSETDIFTALRNSKGNLILSYTLVLAPVSSISKVLINDVEAANTNYTLDTETGEIVFNSGVLNDFDIIKVIYIPEIYKQAELYLCAHNINLSTNILSRDGNPSPVGENLERKKDELLYIIKNRLIISKWH